MITIATTEELLKYKQGEKVVIPADCTIVGDVRVRGRFYAYGQVYINSTPLHKEEIIVEYDLHVMGMLSIRGTLDVRELWA